MAALRLLVHSMINILSCFFMDDFVKLPYVALFSYSISKKNNMETSPSPILFRPSTVADFISTL